MDTICLLAGKSYTRYAVRKLSTPIVGPSEHIEGLVVDNLLDGLQIDGELLVVLRVVQLFDRSGKCVDTMPLERRLLQL
jgi:hypothetical protein